jgi:hypothetical protein
MRYYPKELGNVKPCSYLRSRLDLHITGFSYELLVIMNRNRRRQCHLLPSCYWRFQCDKSIGICLFPENFYLDSIFLCMFHATVFFSKSMVSCKVIHEKQNISKKTHCRCLHDEALLPEILECLECECN